MDKLTLVEDIYLRDICHHRLRFGKPEHVVRLDKTKRLMGFEPGKTFGYIRWSRNVYGTQNWQFIVAQASLAGRISTYPGLHPGADIWFRARGKSAVKRALSWLDKVEKVSDISLQDLPESFWRRAENARNLRQSLPFPGDIMSEYTRLSHV